MTMERSEVEKFAISASLCIAVAFICPFEIVIPAIGLWIVLSAIVLE